MPSICFLDAKLVYFEPLVYFDPVMYFDPLNEVEPIMHFAKHTPQAYTEWRRRRSFGVRKPRLRLCGSESEPLSSSALHCSSQLPGLPRPGGELYILPSIRSLDAAF
jgi:hypothetical protein